MLAGERVTDKLLRTKFRRWCYGEDVVPLDDAIRYAIVPYRAQNGASAKDCKNGS